MGTVEQRHFVWRDSLSFNNMNHIFNLWFLLILLHLSLADDLVERHEEEEFGIEVDEKEDKEFKTKAHFDPGTFYYVLSQNPQNPHQAQVAPLVPQPQSNSRPVWKTAFPNNFGQQSTKT